MGKEELSSSRFELETVCVLDRRDNQLHHEDYMYSVTVETDLVINLWLPRIKEILFLSVRFPAPPFAL